MTAASLSKRGSASKPQKPDKPYPDFPLTPHASGKWCKKIRGRLHYFGKWDDPIAALNEWLAVKDNLMAGIDRDDKRDARYDIDWLVNAFLDSKDQQKSEGELSAQSFRDYFKICTRISEFFGKERSLESLDSPDFKRFRASFPKTWGPTTVNNAITRTSVVLNFAYESGAVDKPIRTGPNFKRVSKKRQRMERAKKHKKEFSATEIHKLLDLADVQMKAMIMLGINAGYGNADVGRLEVTMIDFGKSWLAGLRDKTAVERAAWLWPETVTALKDAIKHRYDNAPPSLQGRVFITKRRQAWFTEDGYNDAISAAFRKLTVKAECRRLGVGFYSLRHVFETVAGDSKDQIAVNYVMGHADASMAAVYREGIDPKRIKDVCQRVRRWWLAGKPKTKAEGKSIVGRKSQGGTK